MALNQAATPRFHQYLDPAWYHLFALITTHWKTNMPPENQWLEDVFPIEIAPF